MKVPFIFGPNDVRLCDIDVPRAGPRDVVLAVGAAGICGSDLGFIAAGGMTGPTDHPVPIGHELAGTVAEVGSEVTGVRPGDRVVVNPLVNMIGNGAPEGGFAERLLIRDVAGKPGSLLPLPDRLTMSEGALVEPVAVAAHAINRLGAAAGDKVAIVGAGPIGLACLVVLRHRGVDDVAIFDLSSFRRDRARQLGAAHAFDPREHAIADALTEVHGSTRIFRGHGPATTHYLEASGAPVVPDLVAMARLKAVICIASVQKKARPIDLMAVMTKELTLTGTLGYPTEIPDVLAMLAAGEIDLSPMISHRFAGDDFMPALDMAGRPGEAAKVLIEYER